MTEKLVDHSEVWDSLQEDSGEEGHVIEARGLTKRFGDKLAVDGLTFGVRPGTVTGFLGPNGAGKSTTMRMILGLDRPTGGTVTVHGRAYGDLVAPMREVGALLDAKAVDGARTARDHLGWLARAGGLPVRRVDEVLDLVGLADVAGQRVGGFSLGMSQRLGIAAALLGDPPVLLFDEPVNGLDPEGIRWVRTLVRGFATEGRTVMVSSHLMSEMEATADQVLVIGQGRLIADSTMADFTRLGSGGHVRVVTPDVAGLRRVVEGAGATLAPAPDGASQVFGLDNVRIADLAAEAGIRLHELTPRPASLETTFMELTNDAVEYRTGTDGEPAEPIGADR
jgi:ABC-2 type transport system ATP-binding protein